MVLAIDGQFCPALVAIPGTSKLVMSDEAKAFLEQYQSRKPGLSPDSGECSKTGWTTIRSLPDGLVAGFDSRAFAGKPEM